MPFRGDLLRVAAERAVERVGDHVDGLFEVLFLQHQRRQEADDVGTGCKRQNALALQRLDDLFRVAVDDKTEDWGYAWLSPIRPVALPEDPATAVLAFDVNGGRTPLGRRDTGRQRFRVQLTCPTPDKKDADGPWMRDPPVEDGQVDDDPNSWQTVRIPLAKLLPEGATAIGRITLQYTGLPSTGRAGLIVRDFRFENGNAPSAPHEP